MSIREVFEIFSSFRAQLVAFVAIALALTMTTLSLVNQQLESRMTRVIDEYIRSIPLATGLVFRSLFKGDELYNMVNLSDPESLAVNSDSAIKQIFIVDSENKIFDSTDKNAIGKPYKPDHNDQPVGMGNLKNDLDEIGAKTSQLLSFSLATAVEDANTGERKDSNRTIYIDISLKRLQQVKKAGERSRLIVFALLGLFMITAMAIFSNRFTRRWAPVRPVG